MEEGAKEAKAAIFQIIHNQISDNDPPETKITYDRLLFSGKSKKEVMDLIGAVVSVEIFEIMKHKSVFNRSRFIENLTNLPKLP